jgi:hypothetical protein
VTMETQYRCDLVNRYSDIHEREISPQTRRSNALATFKLSKVPESLAQTQCAGKAKYIVPSYNSLSSHQNNCPIISTNVLIENRSRSRS